MSDLHQEINFEAEICQHLATHGWLYAEGDAAGYDRARALFPADVLAWVKETQPKAWEALEKNDGASAGTVLLDRLRKSLDDRGRSTCCGTASNCSACAARWRWPGSNRPWPMNEGLLARYAANRLRVVRQLRYSLHNENAIDLGLFLNGIPVATAELKSDFTQSVEDAVDQYRFDRAPRPKGQGSAEPLLSLPNGALVHFAVSNSEVRMTTRLDGPGTSFLPFNLSPSPQPLSHQGRGARISSSTGESAALSPLAPGGRGDGGEGEKYGHRTAYLWEDIWARDSWLEILGRYLLAQRDDKQLKTIIFPRYHQLDATRKLLAALLAEGPGGKYLIQHSAGSGKTNSIAWSAHFKADLHDASHEKLFDTVLVVSDRTVLDSQLQEAIFDFERTAGVVATIKGDGASKSNELAAAKLKAVLSAEELQELSDGGEVSTEDLLAAQMAARAADKGISYVAFTATPKAKTLELFGRRPKPDLPAGPDNLPAPFHVYSMRQAIEEDFILDVLKNYTHYKPAFKLAHDGKELDDREVERSEALKGIMRWVRPPPYNISQKMQVVVEHFRENVAPLLNGRGKALVVVGSRVEAVRWRLAIDRYVKEQGYKIGTLVAFSGEVNDPESGPDPFSETSKTMNPNLKGQGIREAFDTGDYQVLLVANKSQTGFDQPLLCGMYVDKRLTGIAAVQTLSRLNRPLRARTPPISWIS